MSKVVKILKQSGRYLTIIGVFIFTFCFAMFQGGFVSWFIFQLKKEVPELPNVVRNM